MSGFGENPFYGGGEDISPRTHHLAAEAARGEHTSASHSLRPVTLKQLVEASQAHTDADWMIGDVEVAQFTTIAQVLSVQPQTTNCTYLLNDGTANMEARQWVDANTEEEGGNREEIKEGTYVRVLGSLKVFGNKRFITATHIKPYKGANELFFHIAEAATVTLIFERGPPPRPSEGAHAVMNRVNGSNGGQSAYTAQSTTTVAGSAQFAHLPPLQREIIGFILSQPKSDEGVHVAAIARHIASAGEGAGDANKISQALDQLMDQGHVYSTIDDSHFSVSE
ncbi:replication protein A subunit RPA32 [Trametes elegans]|nr:replication protein A subunit RPA32 [Trametes elegans]